MNKHRFRIGQTVRFTPAFQVDRTASIPTGSFRVVALMPDYLGNNQYRVESTRDSHQRVVVETDIALI